MLKKNLKGFIEKSMVILVIAAMLAVYFTPLARVFAVAPENANTDYARIEIGGEGRTGITDASGDAGSVTVSFTNGTVVVAGSNLYSDSNYNIYGLGDFTVTATPNSGFVADLRENGTLIGSTTKSYAGLVAGDYQRIDGEFALASATSGITYTNEGDPVDRLTINGSEYDFSSDTITYPDTGDTVTFQVETFATLTRLTSLTINSTTCTLPATKAETLDLVDDQVIVYTCDVPYASSYDIHTTTIKNIGDEALVSSFLWSYLDKDAGTDDYVGNGHLDLVKVSYNGHDYTEAELAALGKGYLRWGEFNSGSEGSATLPVGAEVTVSLIPDAGYQLTSFGINGGTFETGGEVGVYTFEIKGGNAHLGAHFTEVEDAVSASSTKVESGSIELSDGELSYGTARLDVSDIELDDSDIAEFESAAGDYSISTYLDISLYQTVYKGTADDTWDSQIRDLGSDATITLQLEDGVDGNEIVIVHQKHDGTYEVIPTTYDPTTHTITFKTSSFSNYAIASRTVVTPASPDSGSFTRTQVSAAETISVFGLIFSIGAAVFIIRSRLS